VTRAAAVPALVAAAAAAAAVSAAAVADTVQVTASAADSALTRAGVAPRCRWCAIESTADLTPGAPGNADGSREIWRLDLRDGRLVQATDSAGTVGCARVSRFGDLVLAAREDLTPGAPGNADGSWESWIFDGDARVLRQVTAGGGDSFFQAFTDVNRRAVLVSESALAGGANADGADEVYAYDVARRALTRLTDSGGVSLSRGVAADGSFAFVESTGDLVPGGPGNADGSRELFAVDLDGRRTRQLTASDRDARFTARDDAGRFVAVESRGDLAGGGNADGSQEVFVLDLRSGAVRQATSSAGDSECAGFLPRSRRVVVRSREELAPGGDGDRSAELFVVDAVTGATQRVTRSSGDAALVDLGRAPARWAVISCTGDLRPDVAGGGTGTPDLYLVRLGAQPSRPVRLTAGDPGAHAAGFTDRSRRLALDTTNDLVPGGNADGSREAFLVDPGAAPRIAQVSASTGDTRVAAASPGLRVLVLESRGDLAPGAPGNADGSREIYLHRFGRERGRRAAR
jgi:Tol biopolymer transport system component